MVTGGCNECPLALRLNRHICRRVLGIARYYDTVKKASFFKQCAARVRVLLYIDGFGNEQELTPRRVPLKHVLTRERITTGLLSTQSKHVIRNMHSVSYPLSLQVDRDD